MGGYFFPTQEDYDSYQGYDYSDPLGINKLKKPKEEPSFLDSLMDWTNKYEYEGTHDIDPITGEVTKKSLPGILGGVVGDIFSAPKKGVNWLASKASGLDKTIPAEEILTNALFPKYDSAPIANNFLKPFIEAVPGGALVTAHDNLSKLKESDYKPISDAAEVGESTLRGVTRGAGSLLLDPILWTGLNAPGLLGTGIGAYFGVEGLSGAGEKLGESYSKAFDQGDTSGAIEPFIEALIFGGLGAKGIEHSGKSLPEVKFGDYSSRSKLNFESSPAPREIPNFASTMADGRTPSSEAGFLDFLKDDPLLKRRDELKALGVLVNPTGRVPKTESLFHGTGNAWAEGSRPVNQAEIDAWHEAASDSIEFGRDPSTLGKPPDPIYAPVSEYAPFSSRKASSQSLHGGPFYLTDAMPVAEGSYAAAGEGKGPNPEIINADVTTNKTWNLDAPVPRDIRVKGLTILQQLIKGAENPLQKRAYQRSYENLKAATTGRDFENIMGDLITDTSGLDILDRFDSSGLHKVESGLFKTPPTGNVPLRQRDLSGKDKWLRVLESDLGYDSVTHGSKLTGGKVTIPFSRTQIKTKGAQKLTPLSERSTESLVAEYKSLDPSKESNQSLREAIKETLIRRFIDDHMTGVPTPKEYAADKDAYDIIHNYGTPEEITSYKKVEPELTPEDEALIKTPLYESLKNPEVKISESKTPETTDIKDWISEEPKDIPVGEWVDKAARALGYQDLPGVSRIQGESLSASAKFIQSQKRKYGKDWETKQTQSEGDYLRKLLSKELAGEKVSEKEPTVISTNEPKFEEVDPDIAELRDSISQKSPYEMVGKEHPERSSLDRAIEQVVAKRPPKTPKTEEVDIEGEPLKKQNFQVSLSNGEVYTVKATDEIGAREQVQDLIDKHKSKFNITDVKPKYSKLESDLITSANPTEERLATKAGKEVAGEETRAKTWEESQRQKAQLQELRDQLKVEQQFRASEAKRKQKEFQAKVTEEGSWKNSLPIKALNAAKSLAYGGDIGHLLRQGYQINLDLLMSKHAGKIIEQIPTIFKATKSEKYFDDFHKKLASDPDIKLLTEKFGLDMPGLGKGLREEVFHGEGLLEKTPVIGKYYAKPSERAYTAGLNFLRAAEAHKLVAELRKQGKTPENSPEAYRGIARAINIISQRGDVSSKTAKSLSDWSWLFGAPRAKYGRVQNLGELFKSGVSGDITRKTAAKMIAFNIGLMALAKATRKDGEIVTDPNRTDFGKFRDGNFTLDPWTGLGTTGRTLLQTLGAVSETKSKSGGTKKEYLRNPADPALVEVSNMTAPGIRAAWILLTGKDLPSFITGKPPGGYLVDKSEALSQILPLTPKQITEILRAPGGVEKIIYSALQSGGMDINYFDPKAAKATQEKLKKERGLKPSKKPKSSSGTINYKELYNF